MEFNLSEKEFLFLCFAAGATQVYGVEDAFKEVNPNDMSSEIRKVHNSLESKNYIESDFDGNSTINRDLFTTIQKCVNYSTLVMFNSSKNDTVSKINYYLNEITFVKAKKDKENYILTELDRSEFAKDILSNILFKSQADFSESHECVFKQNHLEQIKRNLQSGNKDEAVLQLKTKVNDSLLDVIISALEENEDFYSLAAINNDDAIGIMDTIMIIDTDKGVLIVQPQIIDLENAVKIISCTYSELNSLINGFIGKITK